MKGWPILIIWLMMIDDSLKWLWSGIDISSHLSLSLMTKPYLIHTYHVSCTVLHAGCYMHIPTMSLISNVGIQHLKPLEIYIGRTGLSIFLALSHSAIDLLLFPDWVLIHILFRMFPTLQEKKHLILDQKLRCLKKPLESYRR